MPDTARWSNWAGNQVADDITVTAPGDIHEIGAAVRAAAELGQQIRPIGNGHSFTAIGRPQDVQLSLHRYADLVDFDAATGLVTVQAGMPLHRLNRLLHAAGFALTNLGDIEEQTVAGALSTGTHGTGARFGGLATQVRALELVLADGSRLRCSSLENPEVFAAARIGLGALGVIATVTLLVEPAFALRAEERGAPLEEVLGSFDELADGTDHFEFYWFPHTTRTLTKRNTRLPLDDGLRPLSAAQHWWSDEFLSNTVFGATVRAGARVPRLVRPIAQVAARALGDRTYSDLSYRVFTSPRRVRFVEMEYAVPRAALVPLLRKLVAAVDRSDWRIAVPVEVRVADGDDIWLSTAYGRQTAYVAVHLPPGSPDRAGYFGTLERLAGDVGGRPHWGKLHGLDEATLRGRYPRFAQFVELRDRLDPTGLFSNDYLDSALGSVPARFARIS